MRNIRLAGGPHDGLEVSTGLGGTFLWIDERRSVRMVHRAPADSRRFLYKLIVQKRNEPDVYEYIGYRWTLCVCGVYRRKGEPCGACGSTESAA